MKGNNNKMTDEEYLNRFSLGSNYNKQRTLIEAIAQHTKAIELNPEDASARNNRGQVYRAQGKLGEAMVDYSKAIELDPQNVSFNNNLDLILGKNTKKNIYNAIEELPKENAIYLLEQILNAKTLLGKKFEPNKIQSLFFKDSLIEKVEKDLYHHLLTSEPFAVKTAARMIAQGTRDPKPSTNFKFFQKMTIAARTIAQGTRDQKTSTGFKFFQNMPHELGVKIAASVAGRLSQKTLDIARENFDKPPIASLKK
jgi:tetratricopeptide (TPR) repeat protein